MDANKIVCMAGAIRIDTQILTSKMPIMYFATIARDESQSCCWQRIDDTPIFYKGLPIFWECMSIKKKYAAEKNCTLLDIIIDEKLTLSIYLSIVWRHIEHWRRT